jgi:hypothetical protein
MESLTGWLLHLNGEKGFLGKGRERGVNYGGNQPYSVSERLFGLFLSGASLCSFSGGKV